MTIMKNSQIRNNDYEQILKFVMTIMEKIWNS